MADVIEFQPVAAESVPQADGNSEPVDAEVVERFEPKPLDYLLRISTRDFGDINQRISTVNGRGFMESLAEKAAIVVHSDAEKVIQVFPMASIRSLVLLGPIKDEA